MTEVGDLAANVVQGWRQMFPSYEFAADHCWKKR